jgi:hypothetical protein
VINWNAVKATFGFIFNRGNNQNNGEV